MKLIIQCGILLGFLAVGELIVWLTAIPVPSSILGMLLLTAALRLGVLKLKHVDTVAGWLVANLGFFFIPAGVGVMEHFGLIGSQWLPIVGSVAVSTVVVLAVTGHFHQAFRRALRRSDRKEDGNGD